MFYKFLISLMLCTIISLFFINKPDGQKFLNPALIQQDLVHAIAQIKNHISNISIDTATDRAVFTDTDNSGNKRAVTLYRWQDKQGQWHFSDDINNTTQAASMINPETLSITANSVLISPKPQNTATAPPATNNKPTPRTISSLPLTKLN